MAAKLTTRERAAILERTLREYGDELRVIARANTSCQEDAEDALQTALLGFCESYRYDENAVGWLAVAVKRAARKAAQGKARRASREVSVDPESFGGFVAAEASDPAHQVELNETMRDVLRALAALPEHQRRALLLVTGEHTHEEIYELTGWSPRQTRRYIQRGRAAIREMFASGAFELPEQNLDFGEDVPW